MYLTRPSGANTGVFTGLQYRTSKPPPADSGRRMSYFCTAMVSATRACSTRCSDAAKFACPLACASEGLSGNMSKIPRPRIRSREVIVAC
jgi:hypothetical protein